MNGFLELIILFNAQNVKIMIGINLKKTRKKVKMRKDDKNIEYRKKTPEKG